ncbi:MAG TPA: hypothetical protein VEP72_01535, partial [Microbacterium sp.]|nr:hypothetical protein [Microbacterium sp.]
MVVAPASAAPSPSPKKFDVAFDRATATFDRSKVSTSLREANGQVTAFVQLRADSAVDLAQDGKSRSAVR